jgi:phenylalanyl-tRNA synthetase beta chain
VGESPAWLQSALKALGKNPINNIVDITNFVLLEYGQPSHAFDLDTLSGHEIVVRRARNGEALTTLDGVARTLSEQDLVIADADKAQVLAGVMGGVASGVSASTRRIFLEVAYFQPAFVRLQARRHGLSSDSSYRFERGVDPLCTQTIADHLATLIAEVAGGQVLADRLEFVSPTLSLQPTQVALRPARIARLLGIPVSHQAIQERLTGIGLGLVSSTSDTMTFSIPGFRGDLTREADLMEEVARLTDYNSIPGTLPSFPMGAGGVPPREALSREIRHTLRDLGLHEALHLRFTSRKQLAKLGLPDGDARLKPVLLQNPLSEDWEGMPTTLLPNLLQSLLHNQNNQQGDAALFEISKAFFPREKTHARDNGVREETRLALAIMGAWPQGGAGEADHPMDFYDLKGLVENLFLRLGRKVDFSPGAQEPFLHPSESCGVMAAGKNGASLGWFGILHPKTQQRFELRQTIAIAEISLDALLEAPKAPKRFQAFSTQVAATRDFNALVDEAVRHGEILKLVPKHPLVESLRLRSIYRGTGVPEGQKAMHYEVVYRHGERSLTDEEVQKAHEALKSGLLTDSRIRFK